MSAAGEAAADRSTGRATPWTSPRAPAEGQPMRVPAYPFDDRLTGEDVAVRYDLADGGGPPGAPRQLPAPAPAHEADRAKHPTHPAGGGAARRGAAPHPGARRGDGRGGGQGGGVPSPAARGRFPRPPRRSGRRWRPPGQHRLAVEVGGPG